MNAQLKVKVPSELRIPQPLTAPVAQPASPFKVQTWPLRKLKAHPRQKELFAELSHQEMNDLADDIERNGQREPLEILPDGTIISGHQRRRALVELDRKTALVVVRHDLAQQGPAAIEQRLIEANLHRRHLTKIQMVRLYAAAKRLAQKSAQRTGQGDVRDIVAKRFNMSGRTADRLLPLLDLPIELQQAVDKKRLGASEALRLGKLPPDQVEPILVMLREGKPVRIQVRNLLQSAASADDAEAAKNIKRMFRDFLRLASELQPQAKSLGETLKKDYRERLRVAEAVVHELQQALLRRFGQAALQDDPEDDEEVAIEEWVAQMRALPMGRRRPRR